ncbi:hypothetical protein A3754_13685 [Alcanivorax sp. HI0083]|uniref:hypothetical protein n=1 Tax=unclassified Alcanivorax TaxID=2638842 RepID=UPI0007BA6AEB|nr:MULTISPECIES: hypothetical protein [unclassified Alcanivorax]KZY31993.1 hypothetical protein A3730_00495 [Alcanivorax sp. HI0044]KZZ25665.1 hypothetical protein A3754_13685 [Alcanivorax sp. HI0083]
MAAYSVPFWRSLCLIALCAISLQLHAARDDEADDEMDEVTPEELQMQEIPVDERIFVEKWNEVPYKKSYFTYTDKQIRDKWEYLMRGLKVPYPSAAYMKEQFEKYPFMKEDIKDWNGDYQVLEARSLQVWRKFFAGDFQEAREEGLKLGPIGKIPALFSQLMYAIYLADRQSTKYMMLQDVANQAQEYFDDMEEAADDPAVAPIVASVKLGYAYAIARIAEESPVPIVVARRYIGKIKNSAEEVVEIMPEQPLAHAFRAGVDAGIMRRVGKFTGRMTYGARTTTVEESFADALKLAPDIPIVNYEYANALIYMNRKRDLNEAISYLEKAMKIRPEFSMDALDVMYSYKRLQEVRLYALNFRSFRKFEKLRRKFSKKTDRNLTSIISDPLSMDMLNNPDKYILPERN